MLLESFAKAFSGQDKIKLTIVGDGDERRRLEELTKELGIENQVVYSGKAERDTIKELLHSADGLVHSSSYETFGVVLIEALSCGLPVLSTRNGGAESILISEDCGILSESDVDNYAANLQQFMKKIKNSEYDKFVIRNYVVENFSISKVAVQYRHLYSDITRRK